MPSNDPTRRPSILALDLGTQTGWALMGRDGAVMRPHLHEGSTPSGQPFDLCLSGHTHGGQITLFGLALWAPPGSGPFVSGFYDTPMCRLYVSKGLGTSVAPARFGARPEIAVFDL